MSRVKGALCFGVRSGSWVLLLCQWQKTVACFCAAEEEEKEDDRTLRLSIAPSGISCSVSLLLWRYGGTRGHTINLTATLDCWAMVWKERINTQRGGGRGREAFKQKRQMASTTCFVWCSIQPHSHWDSRWRRSSCTVFFLWMWRCLAGTRPLQELPLPPHPPPPTKSTLSLAVVALPNPAASVFCIFSYDYVFFFNPPPLLFFSTLNRLASELYLLYLSLLFLLIWRRWGRWRRQCWMALLQTYAMNIYIYILRVYQ